MCREKVPVANADGQHAQLSGAGAMLSVAIVAGAAAAVMASVLAQPSDETPLVSTSSAQAIRFVLKSVKFEGARSLPVGEIEPAWQPFVGKGVSLADLAAIARRAEAIYARHGYPFVAIVLNPQQVVDGSVEYRVIEGRVTDLSILGTDPVARRQASAAFQPLVNRTPLKGTDVEAAYERARAVPGLTVAGALHRGASAGGMDLLVQTRREPWYVYTNINNLYPDALGPWGFLLGVDHRGGSRFGDQASAQLYESIDGGRQTIARLSYERSLDTRGTTLSVSALGAWANPGREVSSLDLATNVLDGRVAISSPIVSRLQKSLTATAAVEVDNQRTRIFGQTALTEDKLRILSLGLSGAWRWTDGAVAGGVVELRQGVGGLGGSRLQDTGLSRQGADPRATVAKFAFEGLSPSFHKLRLDMRLEGQTSSAGLAASEQYTVGNLTIGRGYQPGANFGDKAIAAAFEARFGPYPFRKTRLLIEPFAFFDDVRISSNGTGGQVSRSLNSVGGGLRLQAGERMRVDLTYAKPLTPPLGLGEPTPGGRVLINISFGLNDLYDRLRHLSLSRAAK